MVHFIKKSFVSEHLITIVKNMKDAAAVNMLHILLYSGSRLGDFIFQLFQLHQNIVP